MMLIIIACSIIVLLFTIDTTVIANLVVYISQNGLHGEINFLQHNATTVEIRTDLETTLQYPEQVWDWMVTEFPVDYRDIDGASRCSPENLGEALIKLNEDLNFLVLPGNETTSWFKNLTLTGKNGIWGRSLLLFNYDRNVRACGTIISKDSSAENIAEARFVFTVSGSVYFRRLTVPEQDHYATFIYSDLFHLNELLYKNASKSFSEHYWKIYTTDIFEHDHHRSEGNCNFLQQIFDPQGYGEGMALGDLYFRLGKIKIATHPLHRKQQQVFNEVKLNLLPSDLNGPHRTLYLVITDTNNPDNFLACAKIRHVQPRLYKSLLNENGVKGAVTFTQQSVFDPTMVNFTVYSASNKSEANVKYAENVAGFKIHKLPPVLKKANMGHICASTGEYFNPSNLDTNAAPPPGFGSQDQYAIGDLSGKLQSRNKKYYHDYVFPGGSSELNGIYWDVFLPLNGKNSIAHRGLVFYKYNRRNFPNITEDQWGCGIICQYEENAVHQKPMLTAQVLLRYPIVGKILLRQPKYEPWQDTIVIIEYLIHADGSTQNTSQSHRWAIHTDPPGKDFFNWTGRCLSAGNIYNPYKVTFENDSPDNTCKSNFSGLCRLGDLWNRLGLLSIAGSRLNAMDISRKIFIDKNLPLSGPHSILGKSIVFYDDFGPRARGERLACSVISGHYSKKAVAHNWYSNGDAEVVKGKFEVFQQSEYDVSNIEVEFEGLINASEYHIHMVPLESSLTFPCEKSSLYGRFNPRNVDKKSSPKPTEGSSDQYEMGDLSGKLGLLDGLKEFKSSYNDTNLHLFGYESILGRSVVIHKKEKNRRWACSTIESGYSSSEAREIRAIASFHHPAGYAFGYVRMQQLIYADSSTSDTVLEVNLRHPGKNDRNITRNHNWQIFVNPVGVDATVKQTATRCVAGGYVWNPYYTQLADPLNFELYVQECGPDNPLRCYVGDVSARIGSIDIGDERVILSDSNFPLEGTASAVGRSIVIFGPNSSNERFACANIEPDHDLIKYVNLQKPPRFVVAQFLEDVRHVTEAPDWMLDIDARSVKILHGGACIQMIMHFKGPYAHQLEVDLSGLLAAGVLYRPSVYTPGYSNQKRKTTLPYRTCETVDPNEKKFARIKSSSDRSAFGVNSLLIIKLYVGIFLY